MSQQVPSTQPSTGPKHEPSPTASSAGFAASAASYLAPQMGSEESTARQTTKLPPLLPHPSEQNSPTGDQNVLNIPRQRPSRAVDVHMMLNHPQTGPDPSESRRRSAAHFDSPPSKVTTPFRRPAPGSAGPAGASDHSQSLPQEYRGPSEQGVPTAFSGHRHILTPRSPSSLLSGSDKARKISTSFDVQSPHRSPPNVAHHVQSPYDKTSTPADQFPAPMSQTPFKSPYVAAPVGSMTARRASTGVSSKAPSQSASPTASYSSVSQQSQTSPAPGRGLIIQQNATAYNHPNYEYHAGHPTHMTSEVQYGLPSSTTAQSSYRMMTLNTDQGPIQVPVDVQAASKMADDKRKRNAGASARFRQRRKEKEREASQTIAKLDQQAREVTEVLEFYRQERDHFRRIVLEHLGPSFVDGRPHTPNLQHRATSAAAATQRAAPWPAPQSQPRLGAERPAVRSVSAYSSSQLPPITDGQPLPPLPPGGYRSSSYSYEHPPPTMTGPPPAPSGATLPPITKTESYDPYAPDRYDRSWPSSREHR